MEKSNGLADALANASVSDECFVQYVIIEMMEDYHKPAGDGYVIGTENMVEIAAKAAKQIIKHLED